MSRSIRAITTSPYQRYQASQQTQEATFAINVVEDLKLYWNSGTNYTKAIYDIGPAITSTDVHLQLSNSFELWRINSVTIKFQLKTFSGDILNLYEDTDLHEYIDFFTAVRRGKQTDQTLEDIEANSSFELVTWPASGLGPCPPMKRTIHSASLRFASTKMTAPFPYIIYGLRLPSSNHFLYGHTFQTPFVISMQIQAKCSYKGVRLDKSYVLTKINPNRIQPVATTSWSPPELGSLIYTRGMYGVDPDEQMELMNQHWTYKTTEGTVAVDNTHALIVIIPVENQANLYFFTGMLNKAGSTRNYSIGAGWYYLIAPNIFNNFNTATPYLYYFSINNKLIAMQQLFINGLTSGTKYFILHINIQNLLVK